MRFLHCLQLCKGRKGFFFENGSAASFCSSISTLRQCHKARLVSNFLVCETQFSAKIQFSISKLGLSQMSFTRS